MALNTEQRQQTTFFTGYEVEHTAAYGMFTLFVVGTPDLDQILQLAADHKVKQIYFGTSQSFNPESYDDWNTWDHRIKGCLDAGYWVCLDFDVKHAADLHENGWCEHHRFIPMISVKLPYISLYNYNTTVKIDDQTWGATNPGVWTHHLPSLLSRDKFTNWDQYTQDTDLD